jgi:hypothetical protein
MKVGIANAAITPECPIWMTGFAARTEPADGIYADIEASVVVFESGEERAAIIALDLVGVDEYLLDAFRKSAAELGIPGECTLVNCSHTHCAPSCRVVRGSNRHFDEKWLADLKSTVSSLLRQAIDNLQDSVIEYRVGSCTLGCNRRRVDADGGTSGMLPDPNKPIDIDVPVLRVLSLDGEPRATLFTYAAHPTTMGGQQIGPDYPGPARDYLRKQTPGCIPIFLQGCGGDVKPRNVTPDRRFAAGPIEMVYEIGHELGRAVATALCGEPVVLGEELGCASAIAQLPTRGTPSEETLAELEQGNQWQKMYAETARETIAEKGGLAEHLPVEVQGIRIGDLHIVAMGGEISVEIGLEIKQRLPEMMVWTLGYSNLLRCYVASLGAHPEGGYEVETSFLYSWTPEPRPLGLKPESVAVLVDTALSIVQSL